MIKKPVFAQIISAIFHPILWVFYILVWITFLYQTVFTEKKSLIIFLLISFFFSVGLPSVFLWILLRFKMISSLLISNRKERTLPLFVVGLSYFMIYQLFGSMALPSSFALIFKGASYMVLLCMMITFFWKISIHMLSIGGTIGFLMALGLQYNWLFPHVILPMIFLSGIIGYSRLRLDAHTPAQVYIGFVVGWLVMFFAFMFLN